MKTSGIAGPESEILDEIQKQIDISISVKKKVLRDKKLLRRIRQLTQDCLQSLERGGKIIFAGNGGSFADAQHLSAEFTSRFQFNRAPLASIALGTNSSSISAIGNDYGYEQVFARELEGIAKPVDVFIPISTSGNSPNILSAVEVARSIGVTVTGLTGSSGGKLKHLCDCICIPSSDTARIQECHILVGHIICCLVESFYFKNRQA